MLFHTYGCDLKCAYCFEHTDHAKAMKRHDYLSIGTIRDAIRKYEPEIVTHYGGEPLHNRDTVKQAVEEFPDVQHQIATAGLSLDEEFIDWIVPHKSARIHVSIDGDYRIQNSKRPMTLDRYNRLLSLVEYGAKKLGTRMRISTTVDDHNYSRLGDIVALFKEKCPSLVGMEVGHVTEGAALKSLNESTWQYLQFTLANGIDTEWTNWPDQSQACGATVGQSMAIDATGRECICDSGIVSTDPQWDLTSGDFGSQCNKAGRGECDVKLCNLCVVDNLELRGNKGEPSDRCKSVYKCFDQLREVMEFVNVYARNQRRGLASKLPEDIHEARKRVLETGYKDYFWPKLDTSRASVVKMGAEHLELATRAYNRSLTLLTDAYPMDKDRAVASLMSGGFKDSYIFTYDGQILGGMMAKVNDTNDGTADMFIWSEEGIGRRAMAPFHVACYIGAMKLHLEHNIWTMWSEVLDDNEESQRYTNGNWGFVRLGTVPRMCKKMAQRHDVIISYGTIVTNYKAAKKAIDKYPNQELNYLLTKAEQFMKDNGIDPNGDS